MLHIANPLAFEHAGRVNMAEPAYKRWYKTAKWQKLRERQLSADPLCSMCRPRITPATVCDHVKPHKGNEALFWSGPFQSLCATCHNSDKQRIEKGSRPKVRIATNGWPEE